MLAKFFVKKSKILKFKNQRGHSAIISCYSRKKCGVTKTGKIEMLANSKILKFKNQPRNSSIISKIFGILEKKMWFHQNWKNFGKIEMLANFFLKKKTFPNFTIQPGIHRQSHCQSALAIKYANAFMM